MKLQVWALGFGLTSLLLAADEPKRANEPAQKVTVSKTERMEFPPAERSGYSTPSATSRWKAGINPKLRSQPLSRHKMSLASRGVKKPHAR